MTDRKIIMNGNPEGIALAYSGMKGILKRRPFLSKTQEDSLFDDARTVRKYLKNCGVDPSEVKVLATESVGGYNLSQFYTFLNGSLGTLYPTERLANGMWAGR